MLSLTTSRRSPAVGRACSNATGSSVAEDAGSRSTTRTQPLARVLQGERAAEAGNRCSLTADPAAWHLEAQAAVGDRLRGRRGSHGGCAVAGDEGPAEEHADDRRGEDELAHRRDQDTAPRDGAVAGLAHDPPGVLEEPVGAG